MPKTLTFDEAKEFTKIYYCEFSEEKDRFLWFLESDNFFELLDNEKERQLIDRCIDWRTKYRSYDTLTYYVNNVASFHNAPNWIWTYACDLCYWYADMLDMDMKNHSKYVWWIINELWYFDYIKDWEIYWYPQKEDKLELYKHRLSFWFPLPQDRNETKINVFNRYK